MIKKYLPKSLLWRFLFIFIIPFIFVQIIIAALYFGPALERLVSTSANDLSGEAKCLHRIINKKNDVKKFANDMQWKLLILSKEPVYISRDSNLYDKMYSSLKKNIKSKFFLKISHRSIKIAFPHNGKFYQISTSRQRLYNKSMMQMFIWSLISSIFLLSLSVLFLRNQIKPIKKLSEASVAYGKGFPVDDFKPSGAFEIREAGKSFLKMKEHLDKYITERLDMLSHISHDLRTPLTRMRLQLSLMKRDKGEKDSLIEEVKLMQLYVESFLNFAHKNITETREGVGVYKVINDISSRFSNKTFNVNNLIDSSFIFPLKSVSFKRLISNLLDNSSRFSTNVDINGGITNDGHLSISFSDNGPGIPQDKYDQVFLPFIKMDLSRGKESNHSGLGLSIVKDIVLSHGGEIFLDKSDEGGLKVSIIIPPR